MIRRLFLHLVCTLALVASASAARADIQDFTVVNQGSSAIWYIQVSANYDTSWSKDVLGDGVVMPGNQIDILMSGYGDHCFFDIRIEDANGYAETYTDVNLCQVSSVYFPGDAQPAASSGNLQDFVVVNNGKSAIWYIQVSPNYSTSWEEDVLGDQVLMPGMQLPIYMPGYGDHCFFDIRIEDQYASVREYRDVNLCQDTYVYYP